MKTATTETNKRGESNLWSEVSRLSSRSSITRVTSAALKYKQSKWRVD